jgi:hypothetical protein
VGKFTKYSTPQLLHGLINAYNRTVGPSGGCYTISIFVAWLDDIYLLWGFTINGNSDS